MEQQVAPVDHKGRVTIPAEFRDELGDYVAIRKTEAGLLIIPEKGKRDFVDEFLKIVDSEPKRTGKPLNPTPAKMKAIWLERR